ncbi:hypothetical protein [Bacteroides acidifaciens]|uniref:hypothetical protein n=1 Tax=Bacteroides acidifaciens TaxID=85831 RepID=UPI0026E950FC|nr:hypothetical protein [Bacteroides acidifaciens]
MSANISGNAEVGGLLSHEYLRIKNTTRKPLTGTKLSVLKDATTLQMKSEDGGSDAGAVKLLRRTEEERQMFRENMRSAVPIQTGDSEMVTREITKEELYTSLTKKDASDNAAYKVDGALFSAEELTLMREALSDVFSSVKQPGGTLVYSDYAKMGIAENVIRSYAEKNLSEEQTEVIMKTVSEHMDQVIGGEPEAEIVDENLYYGKRITDERYQKLYQNCRQAIKEAAVAADFYSEETKKRFAEMDVDTPVSGITLSASNTELADALRSGFAKLDFENEDELQIFFKRYQDWMKPAYEEVNGRSEDAEEHIVADIALYKRQYKDLMSRMLAASVPHVNLQI